jgi:hypothetical protein
VPIPVACATCGAKLKAPDAAAGRTLKCPQCGTAVIVPSPGPDKPAEAVQTTSPVEYVEGELVEVIEAEIVPVQPRLKPKGIPEGQSRREKEVYATPVDDYDSEPRSRRRESAVGTVPHSHLVLSLSIGVGVLLILVIVLAVVPLSGRGNDGKQGATNNQPVGNDEARNKSQEVFKKREEAKEEGEEIAPIEPPAEEFDSKGLVLLNQTVKARAVSVLGVERKVVITGTVVNRRPQEAKHITLKFYLYDESGAQVGTTTALIDALEANGRWNFSTLGFARGNVKTYRVARLSDF